MRLKPRGVAVSETSLLMLLCTGLLVALLVRTAWQADDAFAAWRLVDNFVHGFGLRYNIDERVQTFTSMLWTFLNAGVYAFTGNIYYTSILLSIGITVATVNLVVWPYRGNPVAIVFAYVAFLLSISFMDFSAAGFENPLSHLVLASFAYLYFCGDLNSRQTLRMLFLLAGLAGLTRLDILAYYVFPLGLAVWISPLPRAEKLKALLFCVVPLSLWHGFSLFYFGFPFQNAAYAKRFNTVPLSAFLRAGADYYLNSVSRDPITLTVIFSAIFMGLKSADLKLRAFTLGIVFYLAWVLYIGGDFMSGRFFSVAFVAAVIALLRSGIVSEIRLAALVITAVVLLGCLGDQPTFTTGKSYGTARELSPTSEWGQRGIADERASWYQHSGLLLSSRFYDMPRPLKEWDFVQAARNFVAAMGGGPCVGVALPTGYFGYVAPRECHIYDTNGQVDPLMARLPISPAKDWHQGHLFKPVPAGYDQTLRDGVNHIADPDLAVYYDKLRLITRGDLWSGERLVTIIKMNLGFYDHYLVAYGARQGG
ncbi:MAG TPA: hypothetical protein VMA37_09805 [Acetobacteraceae bacterium]|nr:hypothetical protein [Acetobacteraceae bacterium]